MEDIKIKLESEYIKLDQLLKLANLVDSGGMAKEVIQEGYVYVNGQICTQRGRKIYPKDVVELDDYLIEVEGK